MARIERYISVGSFPHPGGFMSRYTTKKIIDEWKKLFPKITSTQEILTVEMQNKIELPIPKKTGEVTTKNISYR